MIIMLLEHLDNLLCTSMGLHPKIVQESTTTQFWKTLNTYLKNTKKISLELLRKKDTRILYMFLNRIILKNLQVVKELVLIN